MTTAFRRYRKTDPRTYWARGALVLCLVVSLFAAFGLLEPYLHPILFGLLLATACHPVQIWMENRVGGRKTLAATLTSISLILVVVVPTLLMLVAVIGQGIASIESIQSWLSQGGLTRLEAWASGLLVTVSGPFMATIHKVYPGFDPTALDLDGTLLPFATSAVKTLARQSGVLVGNIGGLLTQFFFMLLVFFFVIRDHDIITDRLLHLLPLSNSHETQILDRIRGVSRSALLGTLVTAMAQGMAGGLAFFAAGLPGLFWGATMAFASLIPVVGTALIWVPVVVWLALKGAMVKAALVTVWCVIVVGTIDNLVRPLFMKGEAGMSPVLIFFAILGGLHQFGLAGLLYGPLIFGMVSVFLYIYQLEFADFLRYQDRK